MKKKIFALIAVWAVLLGAVSINLAGTKKTQNAKKTNPLLALLPPSDAAVTIDAKRLFGEALPQILSANQPMLNEILNHFEELKTRTGVDYKQFQQIAAGASSIRAVEGGYDYEPIVLARGQFNAANLMSAAKTVGAGKYREEKIGERTVYVFSAQTAIEQNKDKIVNSKIGGYLSKFLVGLNKEIALTTYDNNTLAFGSLARVRETFETKTRISSEVSALVSRKPGAIVNFGAKVPAGLLAGVFDFDNDEIGQTINSIQSLSGSLDVAGGNAAVSIAAKTLNAQKAEALKDLLDVGVTFGKASLGGSKAPDKQIYARMLANTKIGLVGTEITIDLQVPQTDINVLLGEKK